MERASQALVMCVLCLVACSEASPVGGTDAFRPPDAFSASDPDAFGPADAFVAPGTDAYTPPTTGGLVLNELASDGDPDFAELYNPTSAPISVNGMVFADADGIAVPPDASHRTTLPDVAVPAGGYLVLAMNIDPPMGATEPPVGPVTPCPVAGVASCLQTSYGIGRTGDTLVLFAPDGTTELARVEYTGDLTGATQSHCRIPNGTGDFVTCTSTPGMANAM